MQRWIIPGITVTIFLILFSVDGAAQRREIRIAGGMGVPGQSVLVRVEMVAIGNENAAGFSLNYDPQVLTNPRLTIGSGAAGAILNANITNGRDGRMGVILAMPAGQRLAVGVQQLLTINFDIAQGAMAGSAQITFGDLPVTREVVDATAVSLTTVFIDGSVLVLQPVTITIAPTPTTSLDEVVVEARGVWNDGCVPSRPVITRDGNIITLATAQGESVVCLQSITPFVMTTPIGKLARGAYTINLIHQSVGLTIRLGSISLQVESGLVNTNASSYRADSLAPDSIVAAFGTELSTSSVAASTLPLPLSLAGTTVRIRDAAGVEHSAPIFFVSPSQVNYHLPSTVATGRALVTVANGNGLLSTGSIMISRISPGIFTLDGSGRGLVAAYIMRNSAGGQVTYEQVWRYDPAGSIVTQSIDLGSQTDQLFLVLYGTGFRSRSSLGGVSVRVGGLPAEVLFAGGLQHYIGLDQCNIRLDRQLIGRGGVEIELIVDGQSANKVSVTIK